MKNKSITITFIVREEILKQFCQKLLDFIFDDKIIIDKFLINDDE